jgi:phosphonoacetaldehyde hydrolase
MTFLYQRRYAGPLRAAILDWAGTVVDHGCMAPPATFVEAFATLGVAITTAEARAPMGMAKRAHIAAIMAMPRVTSAWIEQTGRSPSDADIDGIYERFLPLQMATVEQHSALIPGALAAIAAMRARGLKIGSTTGYPRAVMDVVTRAAAAQGYRPDVVVGAEDTPLGRPSPFPALKAMIDLGVYPVEAVVKIGDTVVDIEEGLNGGLWTIGVTTTGNEVGLSLAEWLSLSLAEQERLRIAAEAKLYAAGAHYVVDGVPQAVPLLDEIDARLARGEKP